MAIFVPGCQALHPIFLSGLILCIAPGECDSSRIRIDHPVNDLIDVGQSQFAFWTLSLSLVLFLIFCGKGSVWTGFIRSGNVRIGRWQLLYLAFELSRLD